MDRKIIYPGAIPLENDLLETNRFSMMGLAKLAEAIMGTSTFLHGLACRPTSPASMAVTVGAGEIYSLQNVDDTAYSSLPADTTHSILKQGLLLDAITLPLHPPSTSGLSQNYLIQVAYEDSDTENTVLPYYNASNPTQAWHGPNNSGTAQGTVRSGKCIVKAKAGIAATTGTQTTPGPDSGYIGAFVVAVAAGQTELTSANIIMVPSAPFLPAGGLVAGIQSSQMTYARDYGTVNAYAADFTPPVTSITDGMRLTFLASGTNTGASTFSPNGLPAAPVYSNTNTALTGGEILTSAQIEVIWNSTLSAWVLANTNLSALSKGFVRTVNDHEPGADGNVQLGTAADADIVTSMTDTTAGRVPVVGYAGWGIANGTTIFLKSIFDIACSGVYNALGNGNQTPTEGVPDDSGNTRYAVLATNVYASLYWVTLISNKEYYVGNVDVSKRTAVWNRFYCTGYKQTAAEVGAMPLITTNLSADLNTLGKASDAGIYQQQANNEATTANHYPAGTAGTLFVTPSAYGCQQLYITYSSRIFVRALTGSFNGSGPWSDWIEFLNSNGGILNGPLTIAMNAPYLALKSTGDDTRQYIMAYKKDGTNSWYVGKANANSESVMLWNYTSGSGIEITGDGIININSKGKRVTISPDGTLVCPGEVTGAYSGTFAWADQYGTKAPFYQDFTSAGASEYHPLIKQRARLSSNAWAFSMGVLVGGTNLSWHLQLKGSGGQDINHQWDTSGNYNCPGQVIPGNYTNFDARYLTKTTPMSRLGAQVVVDVPNHATVSAPAGCVQSAVRCGSDGALAGMGYRPLQILVNGAWVNVQSL